MRDQVNRLWATLLISICILGARASAQVSSDPSVTAQGHATLKKPPTMLRMSIDVMAEGSDINDAVTKLNQKKSAALTKLADLGADKSSIEVGEPRSGGGPTDPRQAQMQQMMRAMNRGGKKPTTTPAAATVAISLKAQWPLAAADPEKLLIAGATLQQKIQKSFAAQSDKKLTPEEQEVLEEMQSNNDQTGMQNPGEPQFTYVAKMTDDEYTKAVNEAYAQAQKRATQIAAAAGAKISGVRTISVNTSATENADSPYAAYFQAMGMNKFNDTGDPMEITGNQPAIVTSPITVSVTFALGH